MCRPEENYLGLDFLAFDLAALNLRRGFSKIYRLLDPIIFHYQPLELSHSCALEFSIERGCRVLADTEHPLNLAGIHRNEHWHMGVVADDLWVPGVTEVVLACRRITPHRFEIGDDKFRRIGPIPGGERLSSQISL